MYKAKTEILSITEVKPPQPKPVDRPQRLQAVVYKLKSPKISAALYITISRNNGKPYELFIHTKDLTRTAEMAILGRLISAIFRVVEDPSFIIEELEALYDANGGYFSKGKYMKSIYAEIAEVIKGELTECSQTHEDVSESLQEKYPTPSMGEEEKPLTDDMEGIGICPECGDKAYVTENGCATCQSCGHSVCGG